MNLQNIISEIEKVDPEVYEKLSDRRKVMKDFTGLAGKGSPGFTSICFGLYV